MSSTKKTQEDARKDFLKWQENPYDIFDKDGNKLVLQENEFFIELSAFQTNKDARGLFISNMGNMISFKTSKPKYLKKIRVQGENGEKDYLQSSGFRLNRAVFFSFYEAVQKKNPAAVNLDKVSPKEIRHCFIDSIENYKDIDVHHIKEQVTDNRLENLEAVPKRVNESDLKYLQNNPSGSEAKERLFNIYNDLDLDNTDFGIYILYGGSQYALIDTYRRSEFDFVLKLRDQFRTLLNDKKWLSKTEEQKRVSLFIWHIINRYADDKELKSYMIIEIELIRSNKDTSYKSFWKCDRNLGQAMIIEQNDLKGNEPIFHLKLIL